MHERRNVVLTVLLLVAALWGLFAWLVAPDYAPGLWPGLVFHKWGMVAACVGLGAGLWYALRVEDKMEDELGELTGGRYFEADGLCFMPLVRLSDEKGHAEISLYYQSRHSGLCEAVIHLRPPANTFASHRGARDVHFAFMARSGAFGVVHQPIAVSPRARGETVEVQVAAAVRWPRGKGDVLRSGTGEACGTFNVDWALAYRQGEHELSGEIELRAPALVHLTMPMDASTKVARTESSQEVIHAME